MNGLRPFYRRGWRHCVASGRLKRNAGETAECLTVEKQFVHEKHERHEIDQNVESIKFHPLTNDFQLGVSLDSSCFSCFSWINRSFEVERSSAMPAAMRRSLFALQFKLSREQPYTLGRTLIPE